MVLSIVGDEGGEGHADMRMIAQMASPKVREDLTKEPEKRWQGIKLDTEKC